MYNIGICDDEQAFATELEEMIGQYARESGTEIRTTLFCNGRELIESEKIELDLIFLDIQMDVMNGLEAAKRIRAKDEKVPGGKLYYQAHKVCASEEGVGPVAGELPAGGQKVYSGDQ